MGYTVIGLSRGSEKHAALRSLGAALLLDPADAQWHKTLGEFLGKRKVNLAIDNVGGPLFNQLIATLGNRGRISVVGRLAGEVPQFNRQRCSSAACASGASRSGRTRIRRAGTPGNRRWICSTRRPRDRSSTTCFHSINSPPLSPGWPRGP